MEKGALGVLKVIGSELDEDTYLDQDFGGPGGCYDGTSQVTETIALAHKTLMEYVIVYLLAQVSLL